MVEDLKPGVHGECWIILALLPDLKFLWKQFLEESSMEMKIQVQMVRIINLLPKLWVEMKNRLAYSGMCPVKETKK